MYRQVWSVLDQGLSSLTNLLAVVALARALTPEAFGTFSLMYAGLVLFLGVSRSYVGLPLAISSRFGAAGVRDAFSLSVSAIIGLSAPIVAVMLVFGKLVGGSLPLGEFVPIVVTVAVSVPIVLLQDLSRYAAIALQRPRVAVASDTIWLCGVGLLLFVGPQLSTPALMSIWLGSVGVATAVAYVSVPATLSIRAGVRSLRPGSGVRESVTGAVLLSNGTSLLVSIFVVPSFGIQAVGSLRGVGTLFGPLNTLIAFLDFAVLSSISRQPRDKDSSLLRRMLVVMILLAAAWAGFLMLLPDSVGGMLLGETWEGARALVPVAAVEYVLLVSVACFALILKVRKRSGALIGNKILSSMVILMGAAIAAILATNLIWVSVALALGALTGVAVSVRSAAAALREDYSE